MMDIAISSNLTSRSAVPQLKIRLILLGYSPFVGQETQTNLEKVQPNQIQVDQLSTQISDLDQASSFYTKKSLGYHVWQSFLNLIIIFTCVTIFTWFGPDVFYSLGQFWNRVITPVKTIQITQIVPKVSIQPNFSGYFQQFNHWVGGLTVTPIAGQSATEPKAAEISPTPTPIKFQPAYDAALPDGNWLVIPRIGVRSELQKNPDFEKALERGLWQVPDFGDPGSTDLPMIVAGHRYGWDWWWKSDYWKYNSFYLLPSLQVGDRVEVIADHRKWLYEIYAGEEGEQISDYSGDLILYTCKYLNSPIRFFRYARLVDSTTGI